MSASAKATIATVAVWLGMFFVLLLGDFHFSHPSEDWSGTVVVIALLATAAVLTGVIACRCRPPSSDT
jgi:hypothetical protein